MILAILLSCADPAPPPTPAPPPMPARPPAPDHPCGPFAKLTLHPGVRVVHCAADPAPNLILEAPGSPTALCSQLRDDLRAVGWEAPAEPVPEGHTVEVGLQRGADRLNLGCTDVAGASTATLSVAAPVTAPNTGSTLP